MTTRKNWHSWKLAALLTLPVLQACSTPSALQPPAVPKLQVTPLPAEISQIGTEGSQSWQAKAQAWLSKLAIWSSREMQK